jgi:Domain of unknown function (DUF4337)
MAELEIHHEIEGELDPPGQRVGVQAAIVAVVLAIVTILSHRAHTDAVLIKAAANDTWQRYQSTRVKLHGIEVGEDLVAILARNARSEAMLGEYAQAKTKYEKQSEELQKQARDVEIAGKRVERRALRFDLGEGLLEIGLVLTSLFFIARRRLFPAVGVVAAITGAVLATTGLLV